MIVTPAPSPAIFGQAGSTVRPPTERRRWADRHPAWSIAIATLVVGMPLIAAVVALRAEQWFPGLDLVLTELRVRDVFTAHNPLIGLPGRIGEFPEQGSHPGPLSFYLLAPTYRILGSSSWALEAGTVLIHLAAIATALWIARRRLGWKGVAAVAALLALVIRGYGQVLLVQPWNPYLPLLTWLVVLLATWAVLCGDHRMLIPLVVSATLCAQTHIPYLPLGTGLTFLAFAATVVVLMRTPSEQRKPVKKSVLWSLGLGVMLWLPPFVDQVTNEPGNIRTLFDHFGTPPEPAIGLDESLRIVARHLDAWFGLGAQLTGTERFVDTASAWRGQLMLILWVVAAVVAVRIGSRALRALHAVIAVALLLGAVSIARIFGYPWFYLTLWGWGITTLLAGAVVWTAIAWYRHRRPSTSAPAAVGVAAAAVAVAASLASTVAFAADANHPEEQISAMVGAVADPTYDAVVNGVGAATGPDARYLVRWSDPAYIGSSGFGLLDELERRGLDVAADQYFTVAATDHRTRSRTEADAQIHLAIGSWADRWRAVPGAVEVASYDPRTEEERAEYAAFRAAFIEQLQAEGLADLVPLVDNDLFGLSLDPRTSPLDKLYILRLSELGQEVVVLVAPADADPQL